MTRKSLAPTITCWYMTEKTGMRSEGIVVRIRRCPSRYQAQWLMFAFILPILDWPEALKLVSRLNDSKRWVVLCSVSCFVFCDISCFVFCDVSCFVFCDVSCFVFRDVSCFVFRDVSCFVFYDASCFVFRDVSCFVFRDVSCFVFYDASCFVFRDVSYFVFCDVSSIVTVIFGRLSYQKFLSFSGWCWIIMLHSVWRAFLYFLNLI